MCGPSPVVTGQPEHYFKIRPEYAIECPNIIRQAASRLYAPDSSKAATHVPERFPSFGRASATFAVKLLREIRSQAETEIRSVLCILISAGAEGGRATAD